MFFNTASSKRVPTSVTVDQLKVTVVFPAEQKAAVTTARALVFFGESEVVDDEEMERLLEGPASALQVYGRTVQLTVTDPKRGNQYVVAWIPPGRPCPDAL